MKTLEFTQNLQINPEEQISPQLADQMTPLDLSNDLTLEQRLKLITFYIAWHHMIITLGEHEHSHDWDPAMTVELQDGTTIGDEPGYSETQLIDNILQLEHPNEDGESSNQDEDCYYSIPVTKIKTISYTFH